MSWNTLQPQIKTLLDNANLFRETSENPKVKFSGYPAAHIIPSDQDADYNTTTENERIYAFSVRMFYSTKKQGVETAIRRLRSTVDSIIDDIDQDSNKAAASRVIGISMPSGYTWINTFAAPSSWGEVEGEALVFADIIVRVKVTRDIT